MGLAASQARFLGITARKSNIEYEGQQVNQQRTALAEEVNALYNKLLAMKLPIAPDTTEFYETKYSFEIPESSAKYNGSYSVNNYYKNSDGSWTVSTTRTYEINELLNSTAYEGDYKDGKYSGYTLSRLEDGKYPSELPELEVGTEEHYWWTYYDTKNKMDYYIEGTEDGPIFSEGVATQYNLSLSNATENITFNDAQIVFDNNNRISTITLPDIDIGSGTSKSYQASVDTTRYHDDEGYQAALRDYTMSKEEYDKRVEELNAETKSLQQEDKVLELRLNQIDTEQNELQTELEAVKAVLDKNIENTFKTFS